MIFTSAHRASKVLYDYLKSVSISNKPWILPANICDCVPQTFAEAGVLIEYVDIEQNTWCINQQQTLQHLETGNYAGVLYVHSYGVEDTPHDFFRKIKNINSDIYIVDDRCLCLPQLQMNDTIADLILFSTGAKKQVNLNGGGYSLGNQTISRCDVRGDSFLSGDDWIYDFDSLEIQKAKAVIHRERLNKIYRENLPKCLQLEEKYQHWRFNIMVENKDEILKALFDNGLFASGHYKSQSDNCSTAKYLSEHVINLFNDFYYTEEKVIRTCEIIRKIDGFV